jgi:hypothetical protein
VATTTWRAPRWRPGLAGAGARCLPVLACLSTAACGARSPLGGGSTTGEPGTLPRADTGGSQVTGAGGRGGRATGSGGGSIATGTGTGGCPARDEDIVVAEELPFLAEVSSLLFDGSLALLVNPGDDSGGRLFRHSDTGTLLASVTVPIRKSSRLVAATPARRP